MEVAVVCAISRVYVANYYSDDVSVIDTSTNTVFATLGWMTPHPITNTTRAVAVKGDGTRVYVTNEVSSGNVTVLNFSTSGALE